MTGYQARFQDTLGSLDRELYSALVASSFPLRSLPYWSPVRKASEDLISTTNTVIYLWETEEGDPYPNSGLSWALDGGMLSLALEQLDEIVEALERESADSTIFQDWPKAVILEQIERESSALLEILTKASGNSALGDGENLFTLALTLEPSMTIQQQNLLMAFRGALSTLWYKTITAEMIGEVLTHAKALELETVLGLYGGSEAKRLENSILELQRSLEVEELWAASTEA